MTNITEQPKLSSPLSAFDAENGHGSTHHLIEPQLPLPKKFYHAELIDDESSYATVQLETTYMQILDLIGEDPVREGLLKTPQRAAKALHFLTQGYHQDVHELLNGAVFDEEYDDMVIVKDIEFYSQCEHHLLPFFGKCHVGYIPRGKIVGLSKIPRIVDMFARRLQVQERLTHQIAHALSDALSPVGVAVVIEAQHMCMMIRGVQKQHSKTLTNVMLGGFRDDVSTRSEFMKCVSIS